MAKRWSTKPAANVKITINRIVLDAHAHAPRHVPNCDIRTGKSPGKMIGRKHLPSVTKIPQRASMPTAESLAISIRTTEGQ
jgi:hypothetical protein